MEKTSWRQRLQEIWLSLTIKKKISFFARGVFFIVLLSIIFVIGVVNFSVNDFQVILEDNARSSEFMEAIEAESSCFIAYIKNPSEEKRDELSQACQQTSYAISRLPYDYTSIGVERYAKTWSIRNSYEVYEQKREAVLKMDEEHPNYINELYKVYNMQEFLQEYARTLMRYTLEEGTAVYINKLPYLKGMPFVVMVLGSVLLLGVMSLVHLMNTTIILPIVKLVEASKKIATNDFFIEDVQVENRDEMGELVRAFNKMKEKTGQYISALEEKREMANLLHKEALEKLEVERRLEATKLELLKNQIKPHFLFNTLNVIGGMANLEEAKTTEKMIKALSTLFRYNLKTPQAEVVLTQELRVVEDYMYLQEMRFGSRISCNIECMVDADQVIVPTFFFQPLIENAIIHGLSKKEEGGRIDIRVWKEGQDMLISIADTGVGMNEERLKNVKNAFKQQNTAQMGIALGNIYQRVNAMYSESEMTIFSKEGGGTVVRLKIPQIERDD